MKKWNPKRGGLSRLFAGILLLALTNCDVATSPKVQSASPEVGIAPPTNSLPARALAGAPLLPPPVTVTRLLGSTAGSLTLGWDAVSGQTYYTVTRTSAIAGVQSTWTGIDGASVTQHYFSGLTSGVNYCLNVQACNANGCSAQSPSICAKPLATPAAPGNFRVTANTATTLTFAWDDVANESYYLLRRSDAGGTVMTTTISQPVANATSTTVTLPSNVLYNFQIWACNANNSCGVSASLSAKAAPTPAAPANFRIIAGSATSLTFNWNAVTNTSFYLLKRSDAGGTVMTTTIAKLYSPGFTASLPAKTTYNFEIWACNDNGLCGVTGGVRGTVVETPKAPSAKVTLLGHQGISTAGGEITWTGVVGATSYEIDHSAANGGQTMVNKRTIPANLWANYAEYSDLQYNSTYCFEVWACNVNGLCSGMTGLCAKTPVNTPTPPATTTGWIDVTLELSTPIGASCPSSGFKLDGGLWQDGKPNAEPWGTPDPGKTWCASSSTYTAVATGSHTLCAYWGTYPICQEVIVYAGKQTLASLR